MKRYWSSAEDALVREFYGKIPKADLAKKMDRSKSAVGQRAMKLGVRLDAPWTPQVDSILRARYPNERAADIALYLNKSLIAVQKRAKVLGLNKSEAFHNSDLSGRIKRGRTDPRMVATQFKKGSVPKNKGTRRPGYTSGRMQETQFKKGRPAHETANYLPIGSLKVSADGYLLRKITDDPALVPARRWEAVHRLVWIATNGPIPEAHIIAFRRGRKTTDVDRITLDALECISKSENARRNVRWNSLPPEINELITLKSSITRRINNRTQKNEEQSKRRAQSPSRDA